VLETFAANLPRMRELLVATLEHADEQGAVCARYVRPAAGIRPAG